MSPGQERAETFEDEQSQTGGVNSRDGQLSQKLLEPGDLIYRAKLACALRTPTWSCTGSNHGISSHTPCIACSQEA